MSPAEAAGTPYGAATPVLRAQVPRAGDDEHTAAILSLFDHGDGRTTARSSSTTAAHDAARHVHHGADVARSGRRDHRADGRRHRRDADADAHRYGRQRGRRAPTVAVRIYSGAARGRRAGADAGGAAHRQHLVGAGRRTRAGPVHGAGHAGQRSGINGVSAPTTFTVAARRRPGQPAGGGSSSSRPPATATATASPTTRTRRTARCRRSPARRSTRAWSPATSSSSTRPAQGRGRRSSRRRGSCR